jgi:hypothetical protein
MRKHDGGMAFPRPAVNDKMGWIGAQQGMSLRDYFAAAALTGLYTAHHRGTAISNAFANEAAKVSYEVADALLSERDRETANG